MPEHLSYHKLMRRHCNAHLSWISWELARRCNLASSSLKAASTEGVKRWNVGDFSATYKELQRQSKQSSSSSSHWQNLRLCLSCLVSVIVEVYLKHWIMALWNARPTWRQTSLGDLKEFCIKLRYLSQNSVALYIQRTARQLALIS